MVTIVKSQRLGPTNHLELGVSERTVTRHLYPNIRELVDWGVGRKQSSLEDYLNCHNL